MELERTVRALNPHIGAYLELDGGGGWACGAAAAEDGELPPGRLAADGRRAAPGVRRGRAASCVVQPPGKRPMPADAYLRGHSPPRLSLEAPA